VETRRKNETDEDRSWLLQKTLDEDTKKLTVKHTSFSPRMTHGILHLNGKRGRNHNC
jgi:hypothetical protein